MICAAVKKGLKNDLSDYAIKLPIDMALTFYLKECDVVDEFVLVLACYGFEKVRMVHCNI